MARGPSRRRATRFDDLLELPLEEQMLQEGFETKSANGRPMGTPAFIGAVEGALGRMVAPAKRGRSAKGEAAECLGIGVMSL